MNDDMRRGRFLVVFYSLLMLFISVYVIVTYVTLKGTDRLPTQVIRFLLTAALCFWLYRGNRLVKWTMVVCLGLGGSGALIHLIQNPWSVFSVIASLAVVYLLFAGLLVFSPKVNAFLAYQRGDFDAFESAAHDFVH